VLFRYLDANLNDKDKMSFHVLSEFEADTNAQSITNLYLSSQISQHKMLFEYLTSDEFAQTKDDTFAAFSANESKRKHKNYLDQQNREMSR